MASLFTILTIRIAFLVITITSFSMMVATAISRSRPPFDPFAPYTDILPGQSRDSVSQRGFQCQFNQIVPSLQETCSLSPQTAIFSEIQTSFATNPYSGRVSQTIFKLPENRLTYGDLVLLWGKPQIAIYGQTANLRWRDPHITAVLQTTHRHFSYWTPITYVAFESAA